MLRAFQKPEEELTWIERIRHASPSSSLVVLSDHATVEQAVAAVRLGVEDYLRKPVSIDAFRMAVKRGLTKKRSLPAVQDSLLTFIVMSCQLISASSDAEKIHEIIQGYFRQELSSQYSAVYIKGVRVGPEKNDPIHQLITIAVESANVFDRASGGAPYLLLIKDISRRAFLFFGLGI